MAESKRRGKDVVDDHVDDEFQDAADETFDGASAGPDDIAATRAGTATKARARSTEARTTTPARTRTEDRIGLWARLVRFFREIAAELRKVIWPTRKELITYTSVVVVFVTVIVTIVASLDLGFSKIVLQVFGK